MSQGAITLTAGMRKNLFSLQQTNTLMERTQKRMATGMRVQTAVDDPVNYFTALEHRQRATDLGSRKDEMSESIQTIMSANEGVTAITSLIASAKALAQSALSASGSDEIVTVHGQYTKVLEQIDFLKSDAGYKGVNLLELTGTDKTEHEVMFNEDGTSKLTITGFDASATAGLSLDDEGATSWYDGDAPNKKFISDTVISALDDARSTLRTEAQKLSTSLSTITIRQDFTNNMINTLDDGATELTNADMNEEGANMLMLQTRQSLGTTSLSLASQAAQSVLRLF